MGKFWWDISRQLNAEPNRLILLRDSDNIHVGRPRHLWAFRNMWVIVPFNFVITQNNWKSQLTTYFPNNKAPNKNVCGRWITHACNDYTPLPKMKKDSSMCAGDEKGTIYAI